MTEKEILTTEQGYSESKIQHICVSWFRQTFPHVGNLLFSVPNGGWRGAKAGYMMVYEGQVKGVADLILLYPAGGKSSLCIDESTAAQRKQRRDTEAGSERMADACRDIRKQLCGLPWTDRFYQSNLRLSSNQFSEIYYRGS